MRCSIKQLKAAAAPEAQPIPIVVANNSGKDTIPGTANSIPITAVNTIMAVTFGLHNEKKLLILLICHLGLIVDMLVVMPFPLYCLI